MNVLFMAYGTPYSEEEIEPYYTDIRGGRKPTPELLTELKERYRLIGRSPLNKITQKQAERLQAMLPEGSRVYLGMKHWRPWIQDAVKTMAEAGVKKAVGLVAAPHFSARSIAEYREKVAEALARLGNPFAFQLVEEYFDHPRYIQAVADRVEETSWRLLEPDQAMFLFTAHSIPERAAADGRYQGQVRRTGELVAAKLGIKHWDTAWQSAGRTPEPWIGPDVSQKLEALAEAGFKEAVVTAVGFPSDHLEVFYDLDYEAQNTAARLGVRLLRTRSLNADWDFIKVLKDVVVEKWAG